MARLLASIPRPDPAAERWHEVDPQAMLDLEALGGSRPAILGLGLAAFGVERTPGGLDPWACPLLSAWPISTRGQDDRTSDHGTIGWWLAQSPAVREAASRALGHGSRAGLPVLAEAVRRAWRAAAEAGIRRWWAKPAAFDLWIWRDLVAQHVGEGVGDRLIGKLRDARTAWEGGARASGIERAEPDKATLGLGEHHDPGADALATALATADALADLCRAGDGVRSGCLACGTHYTGTGPRCRACGLEGPFCGRCDGRHAPGGCA